ncbi:MAG: ATP-binding protein, partial [Halobacteria archaeon]|nr:ATP-binding protein [Halobacteria archaeon]
MVEDLFNVAIENQPCVILMDELDAIASKRDSGNQAQSQRQMVSELLRQLTRIQDEEVVVVGATNILDEIDDAVKRRKRFDKIFEVPLPDAEARKAIIKIHLRDSPVDLDSIDWNTVIEKTQGYAAGDLETIVDTAALMAAEEAQETTS